jgi:excisionase family DNA binding protein
MKTTAKSHHPANEQQLNRAQGDHFAQRPVGLTETEAASYLGLKVFTLRKWRREGSGPEYIRCGARLIRYMQVDVDDWLEQRKFQSNAHELSAMSAK